MGTGPCTRCNIDARLRELLDDGTGRIRPELTSLHHNLLHAEQPDTVLTWPAKNSGAAILRQLAARDRPLTHEALDETAGHQAAQDLRAILVATGALPVQTNMARLEQAITRTIGQRDDPDEQHLLRRYAIWHMLRRLRSRNRGAETTPIQATNLMRHLRRTPQLLDWLTAGRLNLHTARQGDLDSWLTSDGADRQREIGHFIRWTPHGGCFREENPSGTSAPTASPNGSANSGCGPGQARSTALFQLSTELPAALLARVLGIHITVAVAWQHASAGDWTPYAADVSRRRARSTETETP